jgi:hypothetical protein
MATILATRDRLTTRTVYHSELSNARLHKLPYSIRPFSTLNEKLSILHNTTPPVVEPSIGYFAIGIGGHGFTGTGDSATVVYYQHNPDDAVLFDQVPFILRTLDNDLSPAQRLRYALRKVIQIAGVSYIAYYLRRIDMSPARYTTRARNIENGVVTETEYSTTDKCQSPIRFSADNSTVNITSGKFLVTTTRLSLDMTTDDVTELANVFQIIHGNLDKARVSEIAVCSGVDHQINVTSASGSFVFTDAVAVQVMSFLIEDRALRFNTRGWARDVDVGSNVPMLRTV